MMPMPPSNDQRKMLPLTTLGSIQPSSSSARSRPLPGKRLLKSKARAKPIVNWKSREPTVKMDVDSQCLLEGQGR